MAKVFRIIERVHLNGVGMLYTVERRKGAEFRVGDPLYDLNGNLFRVKAIEHFRRPFPEILLEEKTRGLLLEPADKNHVEGSFLFDAPPKLNFLFCCHPLYPHRVDEEYEEEYQAAGLDHSCALFSFEDLKEGKLFLSGEDISGLTVYRGWMLKPALYRELYRLLEERGICLLNTPEEYEKYHLLPGWYEDFKEETAETVWTPGSKMEDVLQMAKDLEGPYIVKDYVKSRKHEWYDACFIRNVKEKKELTRVVENFIERQGEDLIGGVVFRKYERLKQIGFHEQSGMPISEEYRAFLYAGKILVIDDYWRKEAAVSLSEEEYRWLETVAARVKSNFVTVDLARKEDGSLIILELGDGQVSGLQQLPAEAFYRAFSYNPYTEEKEMRDFMESYRKAEEKRKKALGDRYPIYEAVKKEIDWWNPYCLLPDAPPDEFDSESEEITRGISDSSSVEEIAAEVSKVFSDAFEPRYFTVEACMDVANMIKAELERRKLK